MLYLLVFATLLVQSFHSAGTNIEGYQRRLAFPESKDNNLRRIRTNPLHVHDIGNSVVANRFLKRNAKNKKYRKPCPESEHKEPAWDEWTEWSPCSVSCGKGREIRWRHCLQNCEGIETEMEEKSCQLPACGGKLFGLIKL